MEIDPILDELKSPDRARRLKAAFALGEAFAGRAAPDAPDDAVVARVVAALEEIVADGEAGAWMRKRAKRALKKVRGET